MRANPRNTCNNRKRKIQIAFEFYACFQPCPCPILLHLFAMLPLLLLVRPDLVEVFFYFTPLDCSKFHCIFVWKTKSFSLSYKRIANKNVVIMQRFIPASLSNLILS